MKESNNSVNSGCSTHSHHRDKNAQAFLVQHKRATNKQSQYWMILEEDILVVDIPDRVDLVLGVVGDTVDDA